MRIVRIALLFCMCISLQAFGAELPLAPAVECHPRGGLPNVLAKLQAGDEVRIGYLGVAGSDLAKGAQLAIDQINGAGGFAGQDGTTYRFELITLPDAATEGDAAAGGDGFPDGVQMMPIGSMDFAAKEESSFFTTFAVICAVAAAVVVLLLTLCLGAHAVGPDAGKNAVASVSGPEIPWPGRIAN